MVEEAVEVVAQEVLGDLVEVALEVLEGLVALVVGMGAPVEVVDMEDPVEVVEAMGAVRRGGGEVQGRGTAGVMEGREEVGGGWRTDRVEATGCQVEGEGSEEAVEVDHMEEDQVEALGEEMEVLGEEMEALEEATEALEDLEVAVGAPRCPGSSARRCRSRNAGVFLASRSVPRQQCRNVPKQECRSVPQQQCRSVPRQQCRSVPRQQCRSVPKQQCSTQCKPIRWCKVCN